MRPKLSPANNSQLADSNLDGFHQRKDAKLRLSVEEVVTPEASRSRWSTARSADVKPLEDQDQMPGSKSVTMAFARARCSSGSWQERRASVSMWTPVTTVMAVASPVAAFSI